MEAVLKGFSSNLGVHMHTALENKGHKEVIGGKVSSIDDSKKLEHH